MGGAPGRWAVEVQLGPQFPPGEDQPVDAFGRVEQLAEHDARALGEPVEQSLRLVEPGLVELVGGVADPDRQRGRFLFGPALHPDRERGHLPDHDLAQRRRRPKFLLERLGSTLDRVAVLVEDDDPLAGQPMLEPVASRSFLALGRPGPGAPGCIFPVGEDAGFGGGHGRFLRDRGRWVRPAASLVHYIQEDRAASNTLSPRIGKDWRNFWGEFVDAVCHGFGTPTPCTTGGIEGTGSEYRTCGTRRFATMAIVSHSEADHATARPFPSAAEPDAPLEIVPRGLGGGDGSFAQCGGVADGLLRRAFPRPREGPIEIDVATPRNFNPTAPRLAVAVDWPTADDVRVEVFVDDGDPRLAAAVELVSPRNKDRIRSREAFAARCAGYLRRGCGLVVVDAVTTRRADLQSDLLAALGTDAEPSVSVALAAVSYRAIGRDERAQLQAWPASLEVGQPLPTLPLWLAADLAVPLDLEASHAAACVDLRIRHAG